MTTTVIFILLAVVLLVVIAFLFRHRGGSAAAEWPFYPKKPLSVPEQILYHRLVKTLPECIVLAQVQASRVLGVRKGFNFYQWNNRINRLSIDYVVCLKDSTVVAAIELDDSSHEARIRREVDLRKEQALKSAGVPLVRWSVKALPDQTAIRAAFIGMRSNLAVVPDAPGTAARLEPFGSARRTPPR